MTTSTTSTAVAERVRAEMGRQRVSQTEMALRTGVKRTTLGKKINGDVAFTVDELMLVAAALGLSPESLIASSAA